VGYRHSEGDILAAAIAVAKQVGMAGLTFKAVGEHLGISDRTVVYYFASKSDLIVAVAQAMGADLEQLLEERLLVSRARWSSEHGRCSQHRQQIKSFPSSSR
jgi:AcrR family transcriptional regulator